MRIRVLQIPPHACIDGVRLDWLATGCQYDVGSLIGAYLLAEGWAEPAPEPVWENTAAGGAAPEDDEALPSNLRREAYPPYYDGPPFALDRRRKSRVR